MKDGTPHPTESHVPENIPGVLVHDKRATGRGKSAKNHRFDRKTLTPKQKEALKLLAAGENPNAASLKAGYKSRNEVGEMLRGTKGKPPSRIFREKFEKIMEKSGLSDAKLLAPITDALKANRERWDFKKAEYVQTTDHTTRLQASKMGLELKGRFPRDGAIAAKVAVVINTNLTSGDADGPSPISGGFHARAKVVDTELAEK